MAQRIQSQRGFTIVELLIVIVVIGILATIIGISYANATKTARSSQSRSNAYSVQKVAESFYADKNRVPGTVSDFSLNPLAKLPSGVTLLVGSQDLSPSNGQSSIDYEYIGSSPTTATGARIRYWDFETNSATNSPIYVGTASGSSSGWRPL